MQSLWDLTVDEERSCVLDNATADSPQSTPDSSCASSGILRIINLPAAAQYHPPMVGEATISVMCSMLTARPETAVTGLTAMARRGLADEVADAIREAVVSGRFRAGQRLREEELAASLRVSRGPVREAIARLSTEGLVEHQSHRGATITCLRLRDVLEIYSLRTVLDQVAGHWACDNASEEDLRRLEEIVGQYPTAVARGRSAVGALDVKFHDAFMEASHHGRAQHVWRSLRSQLLLLLVQDQALPQGFDEDWMPNHREILAAVAARDSERVHGIVSVHKPDPERVLPAYQDPDDPVVTTGGELRLAPAPRRMIADDVADALRTAVADGRLAPGTRLLEEALARELRVSRGPIREAIARLTDEGLLWHEPHRGVTAVSMGARDVAELFSLRSGLELLAARLACDAATDAEMAEFGTLVDGSATSSNLTDLDVAFHDALLQASHHDRLFRAWSSLRGQLMFFLARINSAQANGTRQDAHQLWRSTHQHLARLLAERNVSGLEDAIGAEVEATRRRALRTVGDDA